MTIDPKMEALEQKVANLETLVRKLTEVIKVEGGGVQIATIGKLTLRSVSAQIVLSEATVNINNGALEVI
jgi:hypothetical protein